MKETGLMFKAPLVRAILDDLKTQTRRILKLRPGFDLEEREDGRLWPWAEHPDRCDDVWQLAPCGDIGDRIYVRETYWAWGRWETRYSEDKGRDEWHFVDMAAECNQPYLYAADGISQGRVKRNGGVTPTYWRRPAILMPKTAARIWLEVTGVRVERLQTISEADLAREGIQEYIDKGDDHDGTPRETFRKLWETTGGDWAANPWVWVIDFKRIEKP